MIEAKRQIDEMVPLLLDHMRPLADGLEGVQYRNILHITAPAGRDFELHIQALITAEEGLEIGIWDTAGGAAVFCSCVGWRKTMSEEFFISAHEALRRFIARLSEEYEILTESCRRLLVILEPSLA